MEIVNYTYDEALNLCDVLRISLVEYPAVDCNVALFNRQDSNHAALCFAMDEERHVITGCAMRADYPIYRRDGAREFMLNFSAKEISKAQRSFMKNYHAGNKMTLQHGDKTANATLIESYIITKDLRPKNTQFDKLADGSWMVSYHVDDPQVWAQIKSKALNGFSIEMREGSFSKVNNKKNNKMAESKKVGSMLAAFVKQARSMGHFAEFKLENGTVLTYDKLAEGEDVFIVNEGGEVAVPDDGTYTIDGKTVEIAGGKITKVTEPAADPTPEKENDGAMEAMQKMLALFAKQSEAIKSLQSEVSNLTELVKNSDPKTFKKLPNAGEEYKGVNSFLQ